MPKVASSWQRERLVVAESYGVSGRLCTCEMTRRHPTVDQRRKIVREDVARPYFGACRYLVPLTVGPVCAISRTEEVKFASTRAEFRTREAAILLGAIEARLVLVKFTAPETVVPHSGLDPRVLRSILHYITA